MNELNLPEKEKISYQSDFICTYKLMDDEYTEELYQIQILQAFNLKYWDDIIVNRSCFELYTLLTNSNKIFTTIVEKAKKNINIKNRYNSIIENCENDDDDDDMIIFSLLFTYDYFDLFHKCICDFFQKGEISLKSLNALMNIL